MNHICLLNKRADEYNCLQSGRKTMIIRGAKLRRAPYEHVFPGDRIYFTDRKNKVVLNGVVEAVDNIAVKTEKQLRKIVMENEAQLTIDQRTYRRMKKNQYIVLIKLRNIEKSEPCKINENIFSCTDSWLLAGSMNYQ